MSANHPIYLVFFVMATLITACTNPSKVAKHADLQDPQAIVDRAITAHGGNTYEQAVVEFTFRGRLYRSTRKGGQFTYERIFKDSLDTVRDILTNDGFVRERNGVVEAVPDTMAFKYSNSINSVIYFAMLPYGLNDAAVQKAYLGLAEIKGRTYQKVRITFEQEGGGKDFDDVFVYWFDQETGNMDYFAYLYHTDGGGLRFREPFNARKVGGIRFADYVNYKADPKTVKVEEVDTYFKEDKLEKLSLIELEGLTVSPLPED